MVCRIVATHQAVEFVLSFNQWVLWLHSVSKLTYIYHQLAKICTVRKLDNRSLRVIVLPFGLGQMNCRCCVPQ